MHEFECPTCGGELDEAFTIVTTSELIDDLRRYTSTKGSRALVCTGCAFCCEREADRIDDVPFAVKVHSIRAAIQQFHDELDMQLDPRRVS